MTEWAIQVLNYFLVIPYSLYKTILFIHLSMFIQVNFFFISPNKIYKMNNFNHCCWSRAAHKDPNWMGPTKKTGLVVATLLLCPYHQILENISHFKIHSPPYYVHGPKPNTLRFPCPLISSSFFWLSPQNKGPPPSTLYSLY